MTNISNLKLSIVLVALWASPVFGQNVYVVNPAVGAPGPVNVILRDPTGAYVPAGGGGGGAATIADGADVTQGAKGDAKNAATDTTAITAQSILK